MTSGTFSAAPFQPPRHADAVRYLHDAVPQGWPPGEDAPGLDASGLHVLAQAGDGNPIGYARLAPDHRIDTLAVLPGWRGRGVGSALLRGLVAQARERRWPRLVARVPASAQGVFRGQGFIADPAAGAEGPAWLHRRLDGPMAVAGLAAAIGAATAVIAQARRELVVYSRALDPGLLDSPPVLAALRRFATARHATSVQVLLHGEDAARAMSSPLLRLAQRLDSSFRFRRPADPADAGPPCAYLADDRGGYYFRPTAARFDDGEVSLEGGPRNRQLRSQFAQAWERSAAWSEFRALGI